MTTETKTKPKPKPKPKAAESPKPAPKPKRKKVISSSDGRPVLYDGVETIVASGESAATVELAKDFLGWTVEGPEDKWEGDFLLRSAEGKVRCLNNVANRPLSMPNVLTLRQTILTKQWELNGEPLIIGRTGLVLNAQHRLIALVLAEEERLADPHWKAYWKTPCTIDVVITTGIEETDKVVNTLDTARPRSLTDVLFRSPFFAGMRSSHKKTICRVADYAIRFAWHRTGAGVDAYAPRRTHTESLQFVDKHPRLLEAVRHVYEEDDGNKIGRYVPAGTAAGLLYLMAASESDPKAYAKKRTESGLDFRHWDKACEFFTVLASGDYTQLKSVRDAVGGLANEHTGQAGTVAEKLAILMLAWNWMVVNEFKEPPAKALILEYATKDDVTSLASKPDVAGIDLGDPKAAMDAQKDNPSDYSPILVKSAEAEAEDQAEDEDDDMGFPPDEDEDEGGDHVPTPEEINERKALVLKERGQVHGGD